MSEKKIIESPLLEVLLEEAELIADKLTDSEALRELPVLGWGLKLAKAGMDIRDRMFIAKLKAFIDELDTTPESIKTKWKAEANKSESKASRIGESLLMVVEQANDLRKPRLYALLFIACIDGRISVQMLLRFVQLIDKCFVSDLMYFLNEDEFPEPLGGGDDEWISQDAYQLVSLEFVGLTVCHSGMEVEITELGSSLRQAYKHAITINQPRRMAP